MKKLHFISGVIAALALNAVAHADSEMMPKKDMENMAGMEKCHVMNQDGANMVMPGKENGKDDKGAWVFVPKGECEKINKGDFSGVSDEVKAMLEMDKMKAEESK